MGLMSLTRRTDINLASCNLCYESILLVCLSIGINMLQSQPYWNKLQTQSVYSWTPYSYKLLYSYRNEIKIINQLDVCAKFKTCNWENVCEFRVSDSPEREHRIQKPVGLSLVTFLDFSLAGLPGRLDWECWLGDFFH